ncbi:MAG TPA: hypothetical protein VE130_05550 [Nitrososphaeraceae archaeon]|nr:hypothetical protein [Nitrososphaeraceae archaeon]
MMFTLNKDTTLFGYIEKNVVLTENELKEIKMMVISRVVLQNEQPQQIYGDVKS